MRSYDYTISIGHLGEQLTLNQWVLGSSPRWCTIGDENSTSGRSASRPVPTVQWTVGKCAGPSVA